VKMEPVTKDEVIAMIRRHEVAAALVSAIAFPIVALCGLLVGWML